MKTNLIFSVLIIFSIAACKQEGELSPIAEAKKEKYLQLVEKYEIEDYDVPESEEVWMDLDLEELEAVYKKLHEQKLILEEREKRFAPIQQMIERELQNAADPKEKMEELAKEYPEYFVSPKQN